MDRDKNIKDLSSALSYRAAEVDYLLGDASKARQKLDWQPSISFKDLVRKMTEHDLELAEREAYARNFCKNKKR